MKSTVLLLAITTTVLAAPAQVIRPSSGALPGLKPSELQAFLTGLDSFSEVDGVDEGLGPRFNLDGCSGCYTHSFIGGTSPSINPQVQVATKLGALNRIPAFIEPYGPVKVVRFQRQPNGQPDGGVHNLFVITGRADAPSACRITQPDFSRFDNLAFRIPTPTFGLGLIEAIAERTSLSNLNADHERKRALGIQGRFNTNPKDGTITRFGWKAQNTLGVFSVEAFNVEVGVTNDLFLHEREEDPTCNSTRSPESTSDLNAGSRSDMELFTLFMRFLAPPQPAPSSETTRRGRRTFDQVGYALCHTPASLQAIPQPSPSPGVTSNSFQTLRSTAWASISPSASPRAKPNRKTSAPPRSEASSVINIYLALPESQRQDILNFLRSLKAPSYLRLNTRLLSTGFPAASVPFEV